MGEKLKIEYVSIDSIMPYAKNAKEHPQQQIEQIKRSIKDYGMNDPIGVWHNEIVEGHGRLMACKELGITEVPIIRLEHMSDEQRKQYMLVHNQTTMNSDFDLDILSEELDSLLDFDAEFYDFDIKIGGVEDDKYVDKTDIPQYEPSGEEWTAEELYDDTKTKALTATIMDNDIQDDVKTFLLLAANRHTVFNYKRIADYYASATPDIQRLMEQSALVIIDYDDAIRNGYTALDDVAGLYT